jgi:hypothetical protein
MSRKIVTSCQYPPIPIRNFDWCAYFDGCEEDGRYGYGATEAEAIADFIENHAEEYEEQDARQREREADARHNGGLSPLGCALVEGDV